MIHIPDSFLPKNDQGQTICPRCHKLAAACTCPSFDPTKPKTDQFAPIVRLDKSGRSGKIVTVVRGLPKDERYLTELTKQLKQKAASGGTCFVEEGGGVIEIQGDKRDIACKVLRAERFQGI